MARPVRLDEQRKELLPILAKAFGDLGYRRATTAELARRCGVRENILYRHWTDKSAMFVAALDFVYDLASTTWINASADGEDATAAQRLLDYEADHLGEFGNYRIIFSALGDTDDPEIAAALKRMYRGFFKLVKDRIRNARSSKDRSPSAESAAWAVIGIGTIATMGQELGLISKPQRRELIAGVGRLLVEGKRTS